MAAYDELLEGSGQDKFLQLYQKYDATMTALKAGTLNQVLTGQGVGSAPTYTSFWDTAVVVGAGGAPAFGAEFAQHPSASERLAFKKSAIMDSVTINGSFIPGTGLSDGDDAILFTLPLAYRPSKSQFGVCVNTSNNRAMSVRIGANGVVTVYNTSGAGFISPFLSTFTIVFPLS